MLSISTQVIIMISTHRIVGPYNHLSSTLGRIGIKGPPQNKNLSALQGLCSGPVCAYEADVQFKPPTAPVAVACRLRLQSLPLFELLRQLKAPVSG